MARTAVCSFAAALAAAAILVPAGSAVTVYPTLYVNYSLNCTFTITDGNGNPVSSIPPGTYEVTVTTPMLFSQANIQNLAPGDDTACKGYVQFSLSGPGVSLFTTLFNGCNSFEVLPASHFQPSATYTAQDNTNQAGSRTTFTTQATGAPVAPTAPYSGQATGKGTSSTDIVGSGLKGAAFRGTLAAAVSSAGKLALTFKGKPVATLKAGSYKVSVLDKSPRAGFVLQEIRRAAATVTGKAFVGRKTTTIDLKAGQWFFYPRAGGAKSYFLVIA
jgi:hypothetical protein